MKIPKSVIFLNKSLKINIWRKKILQSLRWLSLYKRMKVLCIAYVIYYILCLRKIAIVFDNGYNYDYYFIIRGSRIIFEESACWGENT